MRDGRKTIRDGSKGKKGVQRDESGRGKCMGRFREGSVHGLVTVGLIRDTSIIISMQ